MENGITLMSMDIYMNGTYVIDGVEYSFDHAGALIQ